MHDETDLFPITDHLDRIREGDESAESTLFNFVYRRLKVIAAKRLKIVNGGEHSPTTLVHEAYVRLHDQYPNIVDRKHFFRLAAKIMHAVLVDEYRQRTTASRGKGWSRTSAEPVSAGSTPDIEKAHRVAALIQDLEAVDSDNVEPLLLSVYCGLTYQQIAEVLGWDHGEVRREIDFARAWVKEKLAGEDM